MNPWLVERALLGEVPASRHAEVARAMASGELEPGLDALRASDAKIFDELPPDRVAREIERRLRAAAEMRSRGAARWAVWLAPAAALAAALLFVVLRGGGERRGEDDGIRAKGDARLEIYRRVGDGSERLHNGDVVRAGQQLQLSYVASGQRFGAIVSIDGRGSVTLHYPEGAVAAELSQGGAHQLSFAYELDDAPRFERFVFVTADHPFELDVPLTAAKLLARDIERARTAPLELPSGFAQKSYLLRKGVSR